MISLEEFKKALGPLVNKLTNEEILKLREQQDQEAEIYFNMWLENIRNNQIDKV
jgi:hypothetical protein